MSINNNLQMNNTSDNDTNSEYESDSEYDSDSDSDYDDHDLYFDTDEESKTRFNIVLCELYCKLHGKINDEKLCYNYLNITTFKKLDMNILNQICRNYNKSYNKLITENNSSCSIIKNFNNIVTKKKYIKPQIAQNIILESGHCICIIKTIWIKLIQRTWKKIFALRKTIIKNRCSIYSLKSREITGMWPKNCRIYPRLQGMMSYLLK